MEQNLFLSKIIGVVVAFVVLSVVLVPICDSLTEGGGNGGSGGGNSTGSAMTYTNEGDYYYQDYDKATLESMSFAFEVVNNGTETYANVTVGDYTVRTPTYTFAWDTSSEENPADYTFIMPITQVNGRVYYTDGDERVYIEFTGMTHYLLGSYVYSQESQSQPGYSFNCGVYYKADGDDGNWTTAFQMGDAGPFGESVSTMDELIQMMSYWEEFEGIEYTSARVLSASGDYVCTKSPVVSSLEGTVSFNTSIRYNYGGDSYYQVGLGAYGNTVIDDQQIYYVTGYGNGNTTYYNNASISLNTSSIGGAVRLDGYTISYAGDSSNRFAYLEYADVYAIVPKEVDYSLASGTNTASVRMAYYEEMPTTTISFEYETDVMTIDGTEVYYVTTVTMSYGNHTIVYDNRQNVQDFAEKLANATTIDEKMEAYVNYAFKSNIWVYADDVINNQNNLQPIMVSLETSSDNNLTNYLPLSIELSPISVNVVYSDYTDNYTRPNVPCYLIDENGEYGVFAPTTDNPVYVSGDIFDYVLPIFSPNSQTMGLGWKELYNYNGSTSMTNISKIVASSPSIQTVDGKLTGVSYLAGYKMTGNNPSVESGTADAMVILPLSADNGSEGSSGSSDLGTAGTLIKVIPIFVALGLIMGIMGLFYQNRKAA